nr:hypothetical protein [Tanacetum cinerariifolium]
MVGTVTSRDWIIFTNRNFEKGGNLETIQVVAKEAMGPTIFNFSMVKHSKVGPPLLASTAVVAI